MISIDSLHTLGGQYSYIENVVERPEEVDYKMFPYDDMPIYDASAPYSDLWFNWDNVNMELERTCDFAKYLSSSPSKLDVGILSPSPAKFSGFNILDDLFSTKTFIDETEKQRAPQSPDSGFGQECFNASLEDYADVFSLIDQDRDVDCMESLKLNNGSDIEDFLESMGDNESRDSLDEENEIYTKDPQFMSLAKLINRDFKRSDSKIESLDVESANGFTRTRNDSVASDKWLNEAILQQVIEEDFSDLCEGISPQPVKTEKIDEDTPVKDDSDNLYLTIEDASDIIKNEHSYSMKPEDNVEVVKVEEEEEEVPVKKRKRNEVDEDFNPYQKPKRKAGRPRTNFSKADTQKPQRFKTQKAKASKRTTQASKKLKSCSSVPHDRREQHNQAERERRDMLKKNLDIVEDATPDHVLQMTQIALQSEKTNKLDEFENNENNFTVDVLKKLDELIKREPVSHKPKYKKASRNSKMVVLLGSTYYIGSLEKELKLKESKLAQLKKKYEDSLKRLNPTKSSKKVRRNY